jgi:hypothetical protein
MKKFVLLFFAGMLASLCYAQPSGLLNPVFSSINLDSNNVVTDFSYDLKEKTKVHLQWKVTHIEMVDFFSIERSANGKDFEMIEVFKLLSDNKFELFDESPIVGRSFYRIRTSVKGKPVFSKTLSVYNASGAPYKFYPNPADNLLIVRSDILIDVQIADASGAIRISQPRVQGLQTINVSSLEKGVYVIRFTNKASNVVTMEKLFKN